MNTNKVLKLVARAFSGIPKQFIKNNKNILSGCY